MCFCIPGACAFSIKRGNVDFAFNNKKTHVHAILNSLHDKINIFECS